MQGVRARVTDAAQAAARGLGVRVEHLVEMLGIGQVGVRHDPADHLPGRRFAGRRDELGLTDRLQVRRAVGPVAG